MSARRAASVIFASLVAAGGCGDHGASPAPPARGALPPGIVGQVGQRVVTTRAVGRIAAAQKLDPSVARDLAMHDALFAAGAEASGLAETKDVQLSFNGALARRMIRHLYADAARAPISDTELEHATRKRWLEFDRPEAFRTVHAVVRIANDADDATRMQARAIAAAIRAAVLPLTARLTEFRAPSTTGDLIIKSGDQPDPLAAAFEQASNTAPHAGFEVVVQPLPPVAADGRALVPEEQSFDAQFALAAAALRERGDLAPVTISSFGAHVIMLLERTPAVNISLDARRRALLSDIVNERARAAEKQLLDGLRRGITLPPDADAVLARVVVGQ